MQTYKSGDAVTVTTDSISGVPAGTPGTVTEHIGGVFLYVSTPSHTGHASPLGWALTAEEVEPRESGPYEVGQKVRVAFPAGLEGHAPGSVYFDTPVVAEVLDGPDRDGDYSVRADVEGGIVQFVGKSYLAPLEG